MKKNKGFAFYENFWTSIENLSVEQQKEICFSIAKYGITGEMVDALECPMGFAMTQAFKMAIDNSVERFNENSSNGSKGGRPTKLSGNELTEFLREHPNAKAKEVAEKFGVSESAVQKREEWKNRKALSENIEGNGAIFDF